MPIIVRGETYYTTREACERAGIGKSTFLRWVKQGIIEDVTHADRRGWRLFTQEDINRILAEANRINRFHATRRADARMPMDVDRCTHQGDTAPGMRDIAYSHNRRGQGGAKGNHELAPSTREKT